MMKYMHAVILILTAVFSDVQAQWQQTNGPWSGAGKSIFATPPTPAHENGVILLSLGDRSIHFSSDRGRTWHQSTTEFSQGTPGQFACQHAAAPGQPLMMFVTVGEKVYSSSDDGETWQACAALSSGSIVITAFASTVDHSGKDILLVGTRTGIFRSADNGASWAPANTGLAGLFIHSFSNSYHPDPGQDAILFTAADGVYISTDAGATWQARNSINGDYPFEHLVVDPSSTDANSLRLRASLGYDSIFRSENSGEKWDFEYVNVNWGTDLNAMIPAVRSNGSLVLFAADRFRVYRSDDMGHSWSPGDTVDTGFGLISSLCSDASGKTPTRLFAAHSYRGVFYSDDDGASWTPVTAELTRPEIFNLSHAGTTVYAQAWGCGLYRSRDLGEHWESINRGFNYIDAQNRITLVPGDDTLKAICNNGTVYRSTDEGDHWQKILDQPTGLSGYDMITSVTAQDGSQTVYHFAAFGYSAKIYRSTDRFDGWQLVRSGFPNNSQISDILGVDGKLLVGTFNSAIYCSEDFGGTWALVDSAMSPFDPWDLEVMHTGNRTRVLGAFSYGGFFISDDYGGTWTGTTNGLTGASLNCLAADAPFIFAGSEEMTAGGRFYFSRDQGVNWTRADAGVETVKPVLLHIAPMDRDGHKMLYMVTEKNGVWRRPLSQLTTGVESASEGNAPALCALMPNYPNPFNPSTTIRFSLSAAAEVRLSILNPLGQEIRVLADGKHLPGFYEAVWNGCDGRNARVPSGLYLYRLESGSYRASGKLILAR